MFFEMFHAQTSGRNSGFSASPIRGLLKEYGWSGTIGIVGILQYLFSLCIPIDPNIPLIVLSVSGALVGIDAHHRFSSYKSPMVLAIMALLLSTVISTLFSADITNSFVLSMSFFPAVLIFFLIVELFSVEFGYLMFFTFTILSLIISTNALLISCMANSENPLSWVQNISNPYIVVPNDLVLVSILTPFSVILTFKRARSAVGILAIVSILMALATVIVYESRGGMICSLISIACTAFLLFRRRLVEICTISAAFLMLIDWIQGFQIINKLENVWQSRLFIWIIGWNMFTDSLWFGHGPGTFGKLYLPYRNSLDLPSWILVDNRWMPWAHNLYLEILIEQGIIGFLCLVAMILFSFLTITKLLKNGTDDTRMLGAGIFACFVSIVVAALFELSFIRHWFVILLFSVLGLIHALWCFNCRDSRRI